MRESCQTVRGESMDGSHESTVKCSKQTLDSDEAAGVCLRHTIWPSTRKIEGRNCLRNLHLQRHGDNLHILFSNNVLYRDMYLYL